jgi:hypothetical protein
VWKSSRRRRGAGRAVDLSADLMDGVTAAGHADVKVDLDVWKDKYVSSQTYIDKKKKIYQDVDLNGFFADSEAGRSAKALPAKP